MSRGFEHAVCARCTAAINPDDEDGPLCLPCRLLAESRVWPDHLVANACRVGAWELQLTSEADLFVELTFITDDEDAPAIPTLRFSLDDARRFRFAMAEAEERATHRLAVWRRTGRDPVQEDAHGDEKA